ncbi:dimethylargininase [Sanguibacter sp. A247]|uniref:dimethylargininase n=1 Tax=unclassified Sanguibacter TaxID=2645534 RepID=UPI003FD829DC
MARPMRLLMCPPTEFTVGYEINPWMDASRPVDVPLAMAQWESLREAYVAAGHTVELIDPLPGMPDMVYAANGATVVDGVAYEARFFVAERREEGPAYLARLAELGLRTCEAEHVNEGEGDLLTVGGMLLAGTGWRTERAAHAEAAQVLGREAVTLELVDARFYHLDTALTVLRDDAEGVDVAYFPGAFTPESQDVLARLFPDALHATEDDAAQFALNALSDGERVWLNAGARAWQERLRERGYTPMPVDVSEILRGGGSVKCCTLVLR